MMAMQLPLR